MCLKGWYKYIYGFTNVNILISFYQFLGNSLLFYLWKELHNVNMAINVGTSSIKQGKEYLYNILNTAEVVILNKDEASMLTGTEVRPDTKTEQYSKELIHPDIIGVPC